MKNLRRETRAEWDEHSFPFEFAASRRPPPIPTADTNRPKKSPVTLDSLPSRCLFRRSSAQFPDDFKDIHVENALINYIRRSFVMPANVVMARRAYPLSSLRSGVPCRGGRLAEKRNDEEVARNEAAAGRGRTGKQIGK